MADVILDLCGGTGSWSRPYAEAGYRVEIIDADKDVRLLEKLDLPVYGILCAPPCQMFASSGAWVVRTKEQMLNAISVMDACIRVVMVHKPKFWALENPVGKMTRYLGRPKLYFNPCDYGDPYTKKTGLWGEFNVPKQTPVEPTLKNMIRDVPKKDRQKVRSITPPGFAKAFFEANHG